MTGPQIAFVLKQIVENQLADTKHAIEAGHKPIAVRELADAVCVLQQLVAML